LLLGDKCGAHTFPYLEVKNTSSQVEHEASTSKIGEDQIFYCRQRGISTEDAVSMIVHGFCKQGFSRASHGIRRGGSEAAGSQSRRKRWMKKSGYRRSGFQLSATPGVVLAES